MAEGTRLGRSSPLETDVSHGDDASQVGRRVSMPVPSPAAACVTLHTCDVCAVERTDFAVGHCAHPICADCCHRLRSLYHNNRCPMCKSELDEVVVAVGWRENAYAKRLEQGRWFRDKETAMLFQSQATLRACQQLRRPVCPVCKEECVTVQELKKHILDLHHGRLCDVCLGQRNAFLCEQVVYADSRASTRRGPSLPKHLEKHPWCGFCKKQFFDENALFDHLIRNHFSCFLCEREGIMHQYYRTYGSLESHYRSEHFICENPECKGVVFGADVDLRLHQRSTHSGSTSRSDKARQLVVNLAELHSGRPRQQTGANSLQNREATSAARQSFVAANVVYNADRSDRSDQSGSAPSTDPEPSVPQTSEEAHRRNRALVTKIRGLLDPEALERFQEASRAFRAQEMPPSNYFRFASSLFDKSELHSILQELAFLLPDEDLRLRLLTELGVSDMKKSSGDGNADAAPPVESVDRATSAFPPIGIAMPPRTSTTIWTGGNVQSSLNLEEFPALPKAAKPKAPRRRKKGKGSTTAASVSSNGRHDNSHETRNPPPAESELLGRVDNGDIMTTSRNSSSDQEVRAVDSQLGSQLSSLSHRISECTEESEIGGLSDLGAAKPLRVRRLVGASSDGHSVAAEVQSHVQADPPSLEHHRVGDQRTMNMENGDQGGEQRTQDLSGHRRPDASLRSRGWGPANSTKESSRGPARHTSADPFPALPEVVVSSGSSSTRNEIPRGVVVDLSVAARQRVVRNSALPKLGNTGLPWEKKKNRKQVKAAKEEFRQKM